MNKPIFEVVGINGRTGALLIQVDGGGPLASAYAAGFVTTMAERFLADDSTEFKQLQALDAVGAGRTVEGGVAALNAVLSREPGKADVAAQLVTATDADKGGMGDALAALAKFTATGKPN